MGGRKRGRWTFRTFRTYIDNALAMHEALDLQRHDAQEKAIAKALTSVDARFGAVEQFRDLQALQSRENLPRREYEVQHEVLVARIYAMELWKSRVVGIAAVFVFLAGTFGFILAKTIG